MQKKQKSFCDVVAFEDYPLWGIEPGGTPNTLEEPFRIGPRIEFERSGDDGIDDRKDAVKSMKVIAKHLAKLQNSRSLHAQTFKSLVPIVEIVRVINALSKNGLNELEFILRQYKKPDIAEKYSSIINISGQKSKVKNKNDLVHLVSCEVLDMPSKWDKRKIEIENCESDNTPNEFLRMCGVDIPFHVFENIMVYVYHDFDLLNGFALTCSMAYLFTLSTWRTFIESGSAPGHCNGRGWDFSRIPILVLKSIRTFLLWLFGYTPPRSARLFNDTICKYMTNVLIFGVSRASSSFNTIFDSDSINWHCFTNLVWLEHAMKTEHLKLLRDLKNLRRITLLGSVPLESREVDKVSLPSVRIVNLLCEISQYGSFEQLCFDFSMVQSIFFRELELHFDLNQNSSNTLLKLRTRDAVSFDFGTFLRIVTRYQTNVRYKKLFLTLNELEMVNSSLYDLESSVLQYAESIVFLVRDYANEYGQGSSKCCEFAVSDNREAYFLDASNPQRMAKEASIELKKRISVQYVYDTMSLPITPIEKCVKFKCDD